MAKAGKIKKIRKNDDVVVIAGRDKGKTGTVLRVMPKEGRVLVQGVNMVKRHTRPSVAGPGGIDEREAPLHVSNVALMEPGGTRPTRVGFRVLEDGRKVRVSRRSGEMID